MSETTNLKLKKHDNPETNTEKFDIENYLNGNWDKIDKNVGKVNTDILNINSKNKEQDTNIEQLQENTETSSNKITELEKELKEAQEDFYQNSIRGQASGEYIHVEDSSNCRAKINIGGNHEQETRAGYNLLNFDVKQDSRVTYNNEDGTITINGQGGFTLAFKQFTAKANTKYYIKWELVSGTVDTSKSNGNSFLSSLDNKNIKQGEFKESVVESDKDINGFWVNNMAVFTNTVIKFWANTNKSDFEQYGASPSPDYKSEIESVGSNVNEFDIAAVKDGFLNEKTGKIILNNSWKCSDFIEILNKTYTFGWESNSDYFQVTVCYYDENKKFISGKSYGLRGTFNNTFEVVSNAKYMKIAYSVSVSGESVTREKIKLEKGTVATPYSKYGQGSVKVTKCNKNILDITANSVSNWNGINITILDDKKIKVNGTVTGSGSTYNFQLTNYTASNLFDLKGNAVASMKLASGKVSNQQYLGFAIVKANEDGTIKYLTCLLGSQLQLSKGNYYNFRLYMNKNTVFDNAIFEIQLEYGDITTDYVQHKEQSYIMPTQTEMLENDYLDYDNEEEVHVWNKKVLDGTEEINLQWDASDKHGYRIVINGIKKTTSSADKSLIISNSYKAYIQDDLFNLKYKACGISNRYNNSEVIIRNDDITTVTAFKAYLKSQYDAGTPVVVYYQLATPKRLKFTDEQKSVAKELNNARTYKNVTNITTDSKAILSLDYAKDLETQNQKMQNEIDEIKQLLSTTQTSALLLDNMQNDIESEVE